MYELIKISEQSYYISCPAKIGVYDTGDGVYIVDAGSDKDAGRRVRKTLDEQGWRAEGRPRHALERRPHRRLPVSAAADGLQNFRARHRGAVHARAHSRAELPLRRISAEAAQAQIPHAQPSDCLDVTDAEFPKDVQVIPLPGHFFDQCGYLMPDGTAFIADCVSSPETLEKYVFPFAYDVAAYLDTLDKLPGLGAKHYVPAHAEPCEDIAELAALNKGHMERLELDIRIASRAALRRFKARLRRERPHARLPAVRPRGQHDTKPPRLASGQRPRQRRIHG